MNITALIGRMLGQENVEAIDRINVSFGQRWAQQGPAWIFFGCLALSALALVFYARYQTRARLGARVALAISRAVLLSLLFVILADPQIQMRLISHPRPQLYLAFDGSDSMKIEDEMSEESKQTLAQAVGLKSDAKTDEDRKLSRIEYVQALLKNEDLALLERLNEKFRLRVFLFDRPDGVRALRLSEVGGDALEPEVLAAQLTTDGQVTALGKAFEDLALRHSSGQLAGLVVFSDFAQNSGPAPVGSRSAPVAKLGVPIYTVGVGLEVAANLKVSISARPVMKKAERDNILVTLRQSQLDARNVVVRVTAKALSTESGDAPSGETTLVGEEEVELTGSTVSVEMPYTPEESGRFEFVATVEPLDEEVVKDDNRAAREVNVLDEFMRLLYVAYEPDWEWRFIKEVFHRDKLVGLRGFRTFLRSSDPKVRRTNPLFVPTLTPQRSEFFANDVIFLGDMPDSALSTRFCEMTKEYVNKFGGGLVVIVGSRFGPGHLFGTPLADMLPVVIDPGASVRDDREFRLQLAAGAEQVDFMQLGGTEAESRQAWDNLGKLTWYQPVSRVHRFATVLAEHPTDTCVDGKTPQPLIAIRKYGKGKVVYLAFNETWRLRRKYGERYYRQFWGQMIHHLGLRHALGSQKRFVVRTDRQRYQADDKVLLSVEAFDENFQPLAQDKLPEGRLEGELILPGRDGQPPVAQSISIPFSREGEYEARIPVLEGGEHRIRVQDPVTREYSEVIFQVASVSAERQSAVRDVSLQREISQTSGGRAYDLAEVARLLDEIELPTIREVSIEVFPLWSTWLCFTLVVLLMLSEWLGRKWVNLP